MLSRRPRDGGGRRHATGVCGELLVVGDHRSMSHDVLHARLVPDPQAPESGRFFRRIGFLDAQSG